ncbi:tetratricopeptide repeat-containing sensor histidine kinase [Chryseobacterium gambrini]|uniref:tetratricopeptide repeat-containing sensor histidine kinase n=1 Tax=Chryseobacterium gambrini TaxID=373672 RepID=UPI0022F3CB6F|nr:tetratricopeptide repeat protein [Chryseobacterium gambrini]WBX99732.1 tetratricopeptide repeat protein [Chryseobacterium gambrini]
MKNFFLLIWLVVIFSCTKKEPFKNNSFYDKAKVCLTTNNSDSAFYYFNMAKNEYFKINDSIGTAKSLVNMAIIQSDHGDFYGAIETSLEANRHLKKKQDSIVSSTLASSYNCIAIASHFLKDYHNAIDYHFKALKYSNNIKNKLVYYNNIGDVLITLGDYKSAEKYLEKAIQTKEIDNYSRALNNLAKAKYLENRNYNPLPEFNKALEIRKKQNLSQGQNSSYETLSSYYLDKDKKLSLEYAQKMLKEAIQNNSPDDQITALKRIIRLDPKNYFRNFIKLDSISDRVQTLRNKHKSQFAMVRYDVAQKDAENQRLISQGLIKSAGISALILLLLGTTYWYIKRQKQLKQEKELEVKNTQLKMSKKVHDVVANGIYQVMAKIENQEDFDRDKTLDELEFVYEKSRNLSYEKAGEEKEFSQEISELIASFNNASVKTFTAGNSSSIWTNISAPVKEEVYQVLRELMVNMKKHSNASHVAVKFEKVNQNIEIQYKDNGVGISGDLIYKNGLRNTASRIEGIGGNITFETKIEKGLKVNISFPSS